MAKATEKPLVLLLVIDGWGIAPASEGNAVSRSEMPFLRSLAADYPATVLSVRTVHGRKDAAPFRCELGHLALGGLSPGLFNRGPAGDCLADLVLKAGLHVVLASGPEKCGSIAYYFLGQKDAKADRLSAITPETGPRDVVQGAKETAKAAQSALNGLNGGLVAVNLDAIDLANQAGDMAEAVLACQAVDQAAEAIAKAAWKKKATVIVASDHGSAESLMDMKTDIPTRARTDNPVPFILAGRDHRGRNLGWPDLAVPDPSVLKPAGTILDVAPTVLALFGLAKPEDWPGKNLIK